MKTLNDFNEISILRNIMFDIYKTEKLNYRKRKQVLRSIFKLWYKTPNKNGEYNEDYWKLKFNDIHICNEKYHTLNVRTFLFNNIKGLTIGQQYLMFETMFKHKKINEQKDEN